jgi:hypothetical protein
MAVEDSDLELIDFRIEFDDRTEYRPKLSHFFREGQRTRVIELPPSEHAIRFIDIKYKNTPGGGPASVEVWGFRTGEAAPAAWDAKGWTLLGERTVDGSYDHDRIEVGKYEGKFTKLTMYVEKSDLELLDFEITFGNGERFHPEVKYFFKEGSRTRVIDLPGDERTIKNINLKYKNTRGGGNAKVEIWGWKAEGAKEKEFSWDSNGWVMLGERTVNGHGREDHDRIEVGKHEGKFAKLTLVVLDSDLEMIDFEIKFGKGAPWHPEVKQFFKEGARTRVIDFPGDERAIKFVDFKYRNLPGGGKAKVQVWAKS